MNAQSSGLPRVFVSYSHRDSAHAERLVAALLLNAIDVWTDEVDVLVGDSIYEKVMQGVVEVDYMAVVLTENSLASAWVREELTVARQRELEEREIVLLPLLFEPVELPLHLRARRYADFTDFDAGMGELLRTLGRKGELVNLDVGIRRSVQNVLSIGDGRKAVEGIQEIRSQLVARVVEPTALPASDADATLHIGQLSAASAVLFVDVKAAGAAVPVRVDLDEPAGHVLARVIRALGLDEAVAGQRMSFFLAFRGQALEIDESLHQAGVSDGDHLELGAFTYLIE
jgi:hypothetical protein